MNNEPAFPYDSQKSMQSGMTLRDYFAAQAMPVVLSDAGTYEQDAASAYLYADAMMKAREQT